VLHIYGRRAVKTQLSYLLPNSGTLVNNYMFRPLYRPPSSCTTYYTVTIHYTQCLLLVTGSRTPWLVPSTQVYPVVYNV